MTNAPFDKIEDFRDLDSVNAYYELLEKGVFEKEQMLKYLRYKSRDNARTPFQWDNSKNAGFTDGEPWIMVNPNYKTINAKEQMERKDSVFSYYQELIRLRKKHPIIVYGRYDLLLPEDRELYVYTRTLGREQLLVICNFSCNERTFSLPEAFAKASDLVKIIGNYCDCAIEQNMRIRAYEAIVLQCNASASDE